MFTTILAAAALGAATLTGAAQTPAGQGSASQQPAQPVGRVTVPSVTVTAQKEPADAQRLPLSVTPVTWEMLESAGVRMVADAAHYSPNTYIQELSARKISNPRIRGIGSSPANPGITTYIDGVPQLNTNSSSPELADVEQIEFVRGPQSGLYGRNTLGGLININSVRPSLYDWHGGLSVPLGSFDTREVRANLTGPLTSRLGVSVALGHASRDGFSTNTITGNDIDSRSATFGKAQLLWAPSPRWEARVIMSGERARDGDYALSDLASLRAGRYDTARDFEGETERDLFSTTVLARREGARVSFSSTTGIVRWSTHDDTDLDYSPAPLVGRVNDEEALQFTQEVRLASAPGGSIALSDAVSLRWQAGAVVFTQAYEQEAVNTYAPFVFGGAPFAVRHTSPRAELDDLGFGAYAQGVLGFGSVDLTLGARFDRETKDANLATLFDPGIVQTLPPLVTEETFSNVSPQFALAWHARPQTMLYVSGGGGYKAGGFNPLSLPGSEAYAEEKTRHVEGGVKSTWAGGRVTANAAAFFIDWNDMQLNVPIPGGGGAFFIANVGAATSRGVEFEIGLRPRYGVDLFGTLGLTRARFDDGSTSMGVAIDGNAVPGTPEYTASAGAQFTRQIIRSWAWFVRGEAALYGRFEYDEANTAGQDAYSLVDLRGGVTGRRYSAVVWVKNAFDTFYVPVAFAYGQLAPSGFVGEPGRPRTFGVTLGVRF
ncbi:MAG TPA: TonB-dependent receptor [Vicinamibacterales bacterium]